MCYQGTCQGLELARWSCDDIAQRVSQQVSEIFAAAGRACTADANCTLAHFDELSCVSSCGGYDLVLSNGAEASVQTELSSLNDIFCGASTENGCPPPLPLSCPLPPADRRAVCRNNLCELE